MDMSGDRILLVEDDKEIREGVEIFLKSQGYVVFQAADGIEGLKVLEDNEIDLAIVDVMMPRMDGITMTAKLREKHDFPVIFLSAKSEEVDKILGLNMGADDYITKPFEPEEVLVRVMAAFRRCGSPGAGTESERYTYKDLILDQASRTVTVKQREISLTRYEYEILCILIQQPRKVFSRESLYEQVWKNGYYGEDNTVNVHVSNIRKKIAAIDPEAEYIRTVWGIGFKMA